MEVYSFNYVIMCSRWKSAWNTEKWNETTSQTGIQFTFYILHYIYGLLENICKKDVLTLALIPKGSPFDE